MPPRALTTTLYTKKTYTQTVNIDTLSYLVVFQPLPLPSSSTTSTIASTQSPRPLHSVPWQEDVARRFFLNIFINRAVSYTRPTILR